MPLKDVSVRYTTMKKFAAIVALIATSAFGLRGAGQEKRAHVSDDLLGHITRHTSTRTRVIVHGDAAALAALTTRHHVQVLRMLADGAVVCGQQRRDRRDRRATRPTSTCPATRSSGSACRSPISRPRPTRCAPASPAGCWGIGAIPASPARGLASRSSTPGSRRTPRWPIRSSPTSASSPAIRRSPTRFGHGTHVAGIIAGNSTAAQSVTGLFNGGIAPGVQLINVRVLGRRRRRADERRDRRHPVGDCEPRPLQHPRHQPVARSSGDGAGRDRSAVRGGRAGRRGRHRRRRRGRQRRRRRRRHEDSRRHQLARQFAVGDHRRLAQHLGHGAARRRHGHHLQLARSGALRRRREAGRCGARQQDCVARGERLVPRGRLSVAAPRGQRHQRLHATERHEHGHADGQRRRRAPAAGHVRA